MGPRSIAKRRWTVHSATKRHQSSVNTDCSRNRVFDDEHVRPWTALGVAWAVGTRGGGRDRAVAGARLFADHSTGHHISHSPTTGHPYARSIRRWRLTHLAIHESLRRHMAFPCWGVGEITRSSARVDSIQSPRCPGYVTPSDLMDGTFGDNGCELVRPPEAALRRGGWVAIDVARCAGPQRRRPRRLHGCHLRESF